MTFAERLELVEKEIGEMTDRFAKADSINILGLRLEYNALVSQALHLQQRIEQQSEMLFEERAYDAETRICRS